MVRLEEEVARLHRETSDWSEQSRGLQAELQKEREERMAEVQKINDHHKEESAVNTSSAQTL